MEINLNEIRGNSLVRYGFRVLLAKEFGLYLKEQEVEKILLAESCIEVYEDVEEFLEKSGWRRDNPELCSECYLFENHICRKISARPVIQGFVNTCCSIVLYRQFAGLYNGKNTIIL